MLKLRTYQLEQIEAVHREWSAGHRTTLVVAATGTGKTTLFAAVLKERAELGPALVLAERQQLVKQTALRIEQETGLSVGVEMGDRRTVRSGPQAPQVTVATVQSMKGRRLKSYAPEHFATIVCDEAHHIAAKRYRAVLAHFPGAKVLGVTATPDRTDGIGLEGIFDSVAHEYDIRSGIADGYLVPITAQQVTCGDLDVSRVKSSQGDLKPGELEQAVLVDASLHQMASGIAKYTVGRQSIVFMPGVDSSNAMARVLSDYVKTGVGVIVGTTEQEERDALLEQFRTGAIQYLVNCMVLTEGFDAPWIRAVCCCRPTSSRSVYTQQVGRGLRPFAGKTDCLVLDFVGNAGKHKLVCPADVLAGRPIPPDVAEHLTHTGDVQTDIEQAEARAKAIKEERAAKEAARKAAQRARITAQVDHYVSEYDPFGVCGIEYIERGPNEPPASQKQLQTMQNFGLTPDASLGVRQASALIAAGLERRRKGLCTYKQAATLVKFGYSPDVSFVEARRIIDHLAANRWKRVG